jgi:hypothetical protein
VNAGKIQLHAFDVLLHIMGKKCEMLFPGKCCLWSVLILHTKGMGDLFWEFFTCEHSFSEVRFFLD